MKLNYIKYLLTFSPSPTTHVDRPQNGVKSQVLPGAIVAHLVDAKHILGKSLKIIKQKIIKKIFF